MGILTYILIILISFIILICAYISHRNNVIRFHTTEKYVVIDWADEQIKNSLKESYRGKSFNYVFTSKDMPYGRTQAFLNFFGESIYSEEPFLFLCKRSSRDNEFREYGCIFGRKGIYISKENPNNNKLKEKDSRTLESKDSIIRFSTLCKTFSIGQYLLITNYKEGSFFDRYSIVQIADPQLMQLVRKVCDVVLSENINVLLYNDRIVETFDFNDDCELQKPESYIAKDDSLLFKNTEKKLDMKTMNVAVEDAGVQAIVPRMMVFFGEIKNLMYGSRGYGYAAEYGNNTLDRIMGRQVENSAQQLDEHGRQIKHGADRIVNNVEIQTKYYKTASETIGAVFEKKEAIYIRTDGSGKMMQVEVPKDQYDEALIAMQKRIDSGQVPNISQGESAKDYVRKGFFTYEQSFNIARSGTIESLSVDASTGLICSIGTAGISSIIVYSLAVWQGNDPKEAMKQALSSSLKVMGRGTLIYTLSMQLSRKEIANVLVDKVFTVDGICQGYAALPNPIFNLSNNLAEKIATSNLAKSRLGQNLGLDKVSGRQLIAGGVTVVVIFGPDVVRAMQGKISTKQLAKNATIGAAGMAGAAIGQAVIPIPIFGAMVGGTVVGFVAKKTLDHFIEDDAKEMFRILKEEFIDQTMLANLNQQEFDEVCKLTVNNKKISKLLQNMYQVENSREYAHIEIMQKSILAVTKKRKGITEKDYNEGLIELVNEGIFEG